MKKIIGIAALAALAGAAQGQVVISELLGSTGGADWEYIEIANIGAAAVDITGWSVELWDSDFDRIPGLDGTSPYFVSGTVSLAPGDVYVWANDEAMFGTGAGGYDGNSINGVPLHRDVTLGSNSIENSAMTAVLTDATQGPIIDSWYLSDGGEGLGDYPNRNGAPIAPGQNIPLDGTFRAPGAYLQGGSVFLLPFSTPTFGPPELNDGTIAGGSPGYYQIPAPGALALVGIAGLAAGRRRRD